MTVVSGILGPEVIRLKKNWDAPEGQQSVNKRCEYEVQATNGTEHDFPQIAQGMARAEKAKLESKRARWYHNPEYSDETGPD